MPVAETFVVGPEGSEARGGRGLHDEEIVPGGVVWDYTGGTPRLRPDYARAGKDYGTMLKPPHAPKLETNQDPARQPRPSVLAQSTRR